MKRSYFYLFLLLIGFLVYSCHDESAEPSADSSELASYLSDGRSTGEAGFSVDPGTGQGDTTQQSEPGVITAGEWSDLENWDFWYQLV